MLKRMFSLTAALLLTAAIASTGWAALKEVGPVSGPHGFPLYYTDSNDLSLELCLDAGWCFFDPVDPTDPKQVELGIGGEVFWWMADASAPPLVPGGKALLVLGIEGTFGGDEAVVNGQQISFGRVRVRVDVPAPGTYTITHPFGTLTFNNVTVADGITYTADIGGANFLDVEEGFAGTLQSVIGPFLTWPGYHTNPDLQVSVLDELGVATGEIIQYVGNMDIPHAVVGSPINNAEHASGAQNFFRITGPNGLLTETELFAVMGRVYDDKDPIPHTYPDPPVPNLEEVGPINRLTPFAPGSVADVTGGDSTAGYPLGYPIWYEDNTGLQLTICQGGSPMCISDPVNLNDPDERKFATGGETFWWSADAKIEQSGVDAELVLGVEGTFGGSEAIIDGQQISFGRTRIRITTPVAGNYTVIYPYGMKEFNNIPAGKRAINYTADIGIADPSDPDFAFVGALFSEIGPNFLTWTTFDLEDNDPALVREEQVVNPDGSPVLENDEPVFRAVHYVGDPGTEHAVTGGVFEFEGEPVNYFRVIGPNNIDVRTELFAVSGRVFDQETYRVFPLATTPAVQNDAVSTIGTIPVLIDVLSNDSLAGAPIDSDDVTVSLADEPGRGTAIVNADNTITYAADGNETAVITDSFTYTVTNNAVDPAVTSAPATVTITILPEEAVTVDRAQLDLRKLRWEIRGTGNETAEGRTLTVRLGSATGQVIGTTTVGGGEWRLRAISQTAPPTGPVQIFVVSSSGASAFGPFNVQVR